MPTIAETQRFDDKTRFVSERIRTCGYRFYKLIQTRKKEIPRLQDVRLNDEVKNDVRDKVLKSCDEYVNCLRSSHRGGQIPDYLVGSAEKFKDMAYTKLAPQFVLEDLGNEIATTIFNANYKV